MREKIEKHNPNWPHIPHHSYRILIIGGSVCGKTNALPNQINRKPYTNKLYLYAKDPYEAKYQLLINKHKGVGLKHYDSKSFTEYSNDYGNSEEYSLNKEHKTLIVSDKMIAGMLNNKNFCQIVTKLFIRGRKLNISLVFITQFYFTVPKNVTLNSTHYLIMKIPNKQELQKVAGLDGNKLAQVWNTTCYLYLSSRHAVNSTIVRTFLVVCSKNCLS